MDSRIHGPAPPDRRRRRGFTIIEVFVVLGVLGILIAIAVPVYSSHVERTRVKRSVAEIHQIETVIDAYELDYRVYPADLTAAGVDHMRDPWGNPYVYLRIDGPSPPSTGQVRKDKFLNPLNSDYDLYSKGPDGITQKPLTAQPAWDDIVRASDGEFVGVAADY